MRFRHFNFIEHRAGLRGFGLLATICIFVAGTALGEPIEIVPGQGSTISTNVNRREPAGKKDFESMVPGPTRSFNPEDFQATIPNLVPRPTTRILTPHEKELLDRRRNWVFMTPEELMSGESTEEKLGISQYDKDAAEKQSMTV